MARPHDLTLVNPDGTPLDRRLARVLLRLRGRLCRDFPIGDDDVAVVEVLEEAGRRLRARERRAGPITNLHGFAWVTLRNVATSRLARTRTKVSLAEVTEPTLFAQLHAHEGSAERIERRILLNEVLSRLAPHEREICLWKHAGVPSAAIARRQGRQVSAVDAIYSRAKRKLRDVLLAPPPRSPRSRGATLEKTTTRAGARRRSSRQ
jgi:RNA polymerase sigma factor (sigma-70 family)